MLQLLNRHSAANRDRHRPAVNSVTSHALPLPAIDPHAARLARLCHGAPGTRVARALSSIGATRSATGSSQKRPADADSLLRLIHPAGIATVAFALAAFPELAPLERLHAGHHAASEASSVDFRRPVLRALLAPLLEQLAEFGLEDIDVLDMVRADSAAPTPPTAPLVFAFTLGNGPAACPHVARLWISEGLLDFLLRSIARDRACPTPAIASALHVPGRLLLGARVFAIEALQALEPGDVLLRAVRGVPAPRINGELQIEPLEAFAAWGTAGLQRAVARVELDADLLTLLEPLKMTDHTFLPELESLGEHPSGADAIHEELGSLDIPVSFEVDTLALPLDALASLAPGYVIELPRQVGQVPLKLVAWGRTIGTGELVTVGEHLGVRILSIAHHRPGSLPADARAREGSADDPVQ